MTAAEPAPPRAGGGHFDIEWHDAGEDPRMPSDPDYPEGIDLDLSKGSILSCLVPLPYPAKRIGAYVCKCRICGKIVVCTTAGRADDPRSFKVACNRRAP